MRWQDPAVLQCSLKKWTMHMFGYFISTATDRVPMPDRKKGDEPDKKEYPGPPGWGLDVRVIMI